MGPSEFDPIDAGRHAWNAGRKVGAKRPLKPRQVWAIRFFLDEHRRLRDRALFDLAIDSKLRGCDVVKVKIGDLVLGGQIRSRAIVVQAKTASRCSSRLCRMREPVSWRGWSGVVAHRRTTSFRVASIMPITSAHDNMPGWLMNG